MSAANAERDLAIRRWEELEKDATAREKNLSDEVSCLRVELSSVKAELESVRSDFTSAQKEVKAQKGRVKKKKRAVNKLKKNHDNWIKEAEDWRRKWQYADREASSAKVEIQTLQQDLSRAKELGVEEFKASTDLKTLILQGSEASYWIGFGDGRDAVQQLFPDLDVSSIVVPGAEEEEEGGDAGPPTGPTNEDAPATAFVPIELAAPAALGASVEGAADPSVPTGSTSQLIAEVLLEIQEIALMDAVPLTDATPTTEGQAAPAHPSEPPIVE